MNITMQTLASVERAKLHTLDEGYKLGRTTQMQAGVWYRLHKLEDTKSEVLQALEVYENLGAERSAKFCRNLLQYIDRDI